MQGEQFGDADIGVGITTWAEGREPHDDATLFGHQEVGRLFTLANEIGLPARQ